MEDAPTARARSHVRTRTVQRQPSRAITKLPLAHQQGLGLLCDQKIENRFSRKIFSSCIPMASHHPLPSGVDPIGRTANSQWQGSPVVVAAKRILSKRLKACGTISLARRQTQTFLSDHDTLRTTRQLANGSSSLRGGKSAHHRSGDSAGANRRSTRRDPHSMSARQTIIFLEMDVRRIQASFWLKRFAFVSRC
jgi:hypothetical protein